MRINYKYLFSLTSILSLLLTSSCQSPKNIGPIIPLNTENFNTFPLDGKTIEFKSKYDGLTTNIYVNSLTTAVLEWSKQHFVAQGSQGKAIVEIDDLTAEDIPFSKQTSPTSFFTIEQAGKLEASLALKISIQDKTGFTRKFLEVRANRSQTYPEKATLIQKEKIWTSVTHSIINTLNDKLKQLMG